MGWGGARTLVDAGALAATAAAEAFSLFLAFSILLTGMPSFELGGRFSSLTVGRGCMSGEVAQEEEDDDEEDEAFLPPLVVGSLAFERCSLAEEEEPLVPWWPEEPPWSLDILRNKDLNLRDMLAVLIKSR